MDAHPTGFIQINDVPTSPSWSLLVNWVRVPICHSGFHVKTQLRMLAGRELAQLTGCQVQPKVSRFTCYTLELWMQFHTACVETLVGLGPLDFWFDAVKPSHTSFHWVWLMAADPSQSGLRHWQKWQNHRRLHEWMTVGNEWWHDEVLVWLLVEFCDTERCHMYWDFVEPRYDGFRHSKSMRIRMMVPTTRARKQRGKGQVLETVTRVSQVWRSHSRTTWMPGIQLESMSFRLKSF